VVPDHAEQRSTRPSTIEEPVRVAFFEHSEWDVAGALGARAERRGCSILRYRADVMAAPLPATDSFDLLVVMGSTASVNDAAVGWIDRERGLVDDAISRGRPVLGVCFGGQLLAQVLGGEVRASARREVGWRLLETDAPALVPAGPWLVWHEDEFGVPPGAEPLARSDSCLHAFGSGLHLGVQFHPEVDPEIVGHWVDQALEAGRIERTEADDLLSGFDRGARNGVERAAALFDGFFGRARACS
jgi:GMP synthase (glutamine-hydrolysing)